MYHKISDDGVSDGLTVPSAQLEAHFHFLKREGYTPILLSDLLAFLEKGTVLPEKPVLITFDDGYKDNYTVMYPLLEQYEMKANIFLVARFVEKAGQKDFEQYMSVNDLKAMDGALVEYGLHSLEHQSYKTLTPKQLTTDIEQTKALLTELGIDWKPCVAFPYGAYPKKDHSKLSDFFETLRFNNISLAFRIGNRLNPLPLRNPLLIQRLDIRGDETFAKFTSLLKKGKSLFA